MSCKYLVDGSYSCTSSLSHTIESFSDTSCKPGSQNLPLPYMGHDNCKDACSYFAYNNSCPVMMTGNPDKKSGICECPAEKVSCTPNSQNISWPNTDADNCKDTISLLTTIADDSISEYKIRNCVVSGWDQCSKLCGGGVQTRTVTQSPVNGGAECPTLTQPCNTHACPPPAASRPGCYGAREGRCETCEDVVNAYKRRGWAYDVKNFSQCKPPDARCGDACKYWGWGTSGMGWNGKMNAQGNCECSNGSSSGQLNPDACQNNPSICRKNGWGEVSFPYEGYWYSRLMPSYGFKFTSSVAGIKVNYMNGGSILVNDFGFLRPSGNGYIMPSNSGNIVWTFTSPSTATYAAFGASQDSLFTKKT